MSRGTKINATSVSTRKKRKKKHPWANSKQSGEWRLCKFKSCRTPHRETGFKGHCSENCQKRRQIKKNKGYQFDLGHPVRSGWERKYADWLIQQGIQYFYEPKRFMLNGIAYIPDFFLPAKRMIKFGVHEKDVNDNLIQNGGIWLDTWIEVKGYMGDKDKEKIDRFKKTGRRLLVLDKKFFNSSYFRR